MSKNKSKEHKILLLFKDHNYICIKEKNLYKYIRDINNIKSILIPIIDNPNIYVAIKPNIFYIFSKAIIKLDYKMYDIWYEIEECNVHDTISIDETVYTLIDLINILYNTQKFKGFYRYIKLQTDLSSDESSIFEFLPIYLNIEIYDNLNNKIYTLDKTFVGKIEEHMYDRSNIYQIYESLYEIFYMEPEYRSNSFCCILIENKWYDKVKADNILSEDDILIFDHNFNCYLYTTYKLIENSFARRTNIGLTYIAIVPDKDHHRGKKLSYKEKQTIIDNYRENDVCDIMIHYEINGIQSLANIVPTLGFTKNILLYIEVYMMLTFKRDMYKQSDIFILIWKSINNKSEMKSELIGIDEYSDEYFYSIIGRFLFPERGNLNEFCDI